VPPFGLGRRSPQQSLNLINHIVQFQNGVGVRTPSQDQRFRFGHPPVSLDGVNQIGQGDLSILN
jgi:hypothetical protein